MLRIWRERLMALGIGLGLGGILVAHGASLQRVVLVGVMYWGLALIVRE